MNLAKKKNTILKSTGSPRSLSFCFKLWIFWSWSARSIKRSSCSFLDSCTSVCSFSFSVCRMATVLVVEASCCSSSARLSDRLFDSPWTDKEKVKTRGCRGRKMGCNPRRSDVLQRSQPSHDVLLNHTPWVSPSLSSVLPVCSLVQPSWQHLMRHHCQELHLKTERKQWTVY